VYSQHVSICVTLSGELWVKLRGLRHFATASSQHPPTNKPHNMNAASMFSRPAFSVSHIYLPKSARASNTPAGRLPNPPPAPQPSPLASLRCSPEVLPVHRSPHSDRQGRRLRARGAVHEGNPRDTAVWLLARRHSDSRPPGRQPAKVHCVQRA
jgi:hypothetical protein